MEPVVEIITPISGRIFPGNQAIQVKAKFSDETGLHMVHIMVLDLSNNGHLLHNEKHIDSRTFEINTSFIPQPGRSYLVEAGADDHGHNHSQKQVSITTQ
ncbi:MAG: hypothetical protein ACXWV0_06225 [Flavisolibacter sp.]